MEEKNNLNAKHTQYVKFNPDGTTVIVLFEYYSAAWKERYSATMKARGEEHVSECSGMLGIYSSRLSDKKEFVAQGIRWRWHRAIEDEQFLELIIKNLKNFPLNHPKIDEEAKKSCKEVIERLVQKNYITNDEFTSYSLIIDES